MYGALYSLYNANIVRQEILDNKIMPMFISAAKKNAVIIRTLKQNEIFEYYADGKTSNFIVLNCYEKSATVQKIRIEKYTVNNKNIMEK